MNSTPASPHPMTDKPEIKVIDLEQCRTPGVGIFSGRGRATAIRAALGIVDGDHVELRIPDDVYCLSAGFADTLLWNLTLRILKAPRRILPQLTDAGRDTPQPAPRDAETTDDSPMSPIGFPDFSDIERPFYTHSQLMEAVRAAVEKEREASDTYRRAWTRADAHIATLEARLSSYE